MSYPTNCTAYYYETWHRMSVMKFERQILFLIYAPTFLLLRLYQSISPGLRLSVWIFHNMIHFYGEELLAPHLTPKLEVHSLSAKTACRQVGSTLLCIS